MTCPCPYKESFDNMGAARAVVKDMKRRGKRGKTRSLPQEPYRCECGSVHLADPRRVAAYQGRPARCA